MFVKVIYTAKIGNDRQTRETYMNTNSAGQMSMSFDKDIDWEEPIHMMIEPAEYKDIEPNRKERK